MADQIYTFAAQRLASRPSAIGPSRKLKSDSSNLAEVIGNLQTNPALFREFTALVQEVLPQIKQISVRPADSESAKAEIIVWTDERALKFDELAFSLSESGTGVGQIISLLYVVFDSERPQVILIDEPQNLLTSGSNEEASGYSV